ncbi:hypothetical protein M9458_024680, partial [Cirrhinus mrigala]
RSRRLHWDCPRLRLCAPYGTSCPIYWGNTRNPAGADPLYRSYGPRASFTMTAGIRASIGPELFSLWLWWLGCCVVMAASRRA